MTIESTSAIKAAISLGKAELLSLYRLPQVLAIIPVSPSHWWAGIAQGKYPAGIKLSDRVTCWKSSDIQNLITSLK